MSKSDFSLEKICLILHYSHGWYGQICFLIRPCSCGFCHLGCQILLHNSPDNGFYINSGNYSDSPCFDGTSIASLIWESNPSDYTERKSCSPKPVSGKILLRQFWQNWEMCSSKVPTRPHSGITWWCWILMPPNIHSTRSPLWTYAMIWCIHSLLERKAKISKHHRWINEAADFFPIYRLYNGSFFLNIPGSSGLGKQIKLIPPPPHHLPLS